MASSDHLKPGEKGKISITVNLAGKRGEVIKRIRVHTNDPLKPLTILTVKMLVKDRLHLNKYKAGEIFSKKCRTCHVERGKGKSGFELFRADCGMCHNGRGTAPSIVEMRKKPAKYITEAIREGVDNTSMPGFSVKNNGPLNDPQIESLIRLIKPR